MAISRRTFVLLIGLASVAGFGLLALRTIEHTVDDAFISFRYAQNLVTGHGLVYNAGERVEGYTNFLWTVLIGGAIACEIDAETAGRALGLACSAGLLVTVVCFAAKTIERLSALWVGPVFLAISPGLAVWATGGLETPMFGLFVTLAVCLAAVDAEAERFSIASAVVLGLACLTRPEGVLVVAAIAGARLVAGPRSRGLLRSAAVWLTVIAAIYVPYFLWRWSYYGFLLPNTFYAKVDVGGSQIWRGLAYLDAFGADTGYWLLLPAAGVVFRRQRKAVLVVVGVVAAMVAFSVYVGGDGLPMYRFFAPLLGLLFLLVAWGVDGWFERFKERSGPARLPMLLLGLAGVWVMRPNFVGRAHEYVQQDICEVAAWKQVGRWFRSHAAADASIAVVPAGAMPFFSGLRAIDMLGLNDVAIAHMQMPAMGSRQAGHEKFDVETVLSREPTYIVVGVYRLTAEQLPPEQQTTPFYAVESGLLRSAEFQRRYRYRSGQASGGWFGFFERVD